MDLTRLEKLKDITATCKNLSEAFTYFMDHFGENETFLELGKPKSNWMLENLIVVAATQLFAAKIITKRFLLIHVPKTHFIHGTAKLNGKAVNVIYFDDIKVGIIAVFQGFDRPVLCSRFSAQMMPPEAVASKN